MSKYRFKTQDEFIRDGQWDDDNHCPEGWSQSGEMNHYLGQDVPEGANENCDLREGFDDDGWWFERTNYVLKEEDYTGRWIKALADNIQCTGVKAGEVIQIISKPNSYRLDKTSHGCVGMGIQCPLDTSQWELVEEPKHDTKLSSFPSSGAILIDECDNLKEFKRYLFNSGKTCNEAVGNPKYLAWNDTSFWYPSSTGKTNYKWNELKHFVPTKKDDTDDILEKARRLYPIGTEFISNLGSFDGVIQTVKDELNWYNENKDSISHPEIGWVYFYGKWAEIVKPAPSKVVPKYVKCIEVPEGWKLTKKGTIYKTDEYSGGTYRIINHEEGGGQTTVGKEHCFVPATKQEYDAQFLDAVNMYDAQQECKRRFPIGCTFKQNGSATKITLRKDDFTYSINGNKIYAHGGGGLLYNNGIYAIAIPEEDCDNQDPLYICKQKYRKGMKVRSAAKSSGVYSGEFIIEVTPDKFTGRDNSVDYFKSKGFLYCNGEYAEILEEGIYDISEIIKTNKPSIETVHSVDVNLRTKKQINKHLKF